MKYLSFLFLLILLFVEAKSQAPAFTTKQFEAQVLQYQPIQRPGITSRQYEYAQMILSEMKSATQNNPGNFNRGDYMNVLSAFLTLEESPEHIQLAFEKLKSAEGSCEYFIAFKQKAMENEKYAPVKEAWLRQAAHCASGTPTASSPTDPRTYARKHQLDEKLVLEIHQINQDDQVYRKEKTTGSWSKQQKLDALNQKKIDRLFRQHGQYIGRSLVGNEYASVMWAVIQHSDVETMERYLPVVHQAVQDDELDVGPLKMLLDRYYGLKHGYQFFGSQQGFGFEMADEPTKAAVLRKYGLN